MNTVHLAVIVGVCVAIWMALFAVHLTSPARAIEQLPKAQRIKIAAEVNRLHQEKMRGEDVRLNTLANRMAVHQVAVEEVVCQLKDLTCKPVCGLPLNAEDIECQLAAEHVGLCEHPSGFTWHLHTVFDRPPDSPELLSAEAARENA